jgi:hypothetical protein
VHAVNDAAIRDMFEALVIANDTLTVRAGLWRELGLRPGDMVTFIARPDSTVLMRTRNRPSTPPEGTEPTAVERHPELCGARGALIGVIEVESGNVASTFDAVDRMEDYKSIASMQFILLMSIEKPRVRLFSRDENGRWSSRAIAGTEAQIELPTIGAVFGMRDLYFGLETAERRIKFGFLGDRINIPDDFDSPLPDDVLRGFEGR